MFWFKRKPKAREVLSYSTVGGGQMDTCCHCNAPFKKMTITSRTHRGHPCGYVIKYECGTTVIYDLMHLQSVERGKDCLKRTTK